MDTVNINHKCKPNLLYIFSYGFDLKEGDVNLGPLGWKPSALPFELSNCLTYMSRKGPETDVRLLGGFEISCFLAL